jgi:hypothetical protein
MHAPNPEGLKALVIGQVQMMTPDTLRYTLQSPDSDESFHLITRIEPSPTSCSLSEKTIASPGAFKLLWERHLKHRVSDTAYQYNIFRGGGSVTASAAGWIFEFRMHHLLMQRYPITLLPLCLKTNRGRKFDVYDDYTDSRDRRNSTKFKLAPSSEYPLDSEIELQHDHYYHPEVNNFPMIDSLLLIRPTKRRASILLMFQITGNKDRHDAKAAGLEIINGLKFPQNTRKYYVVVTPLGIKPSIQVPKGLFKDVDVFHHPIDPNVLFPPGVGNASPK